MAVKQMSYCGRRRRPFANLVSDVSVYSQRNQESREGIFYSSYTFQDHRCTTIPPFSEELDSKKHLISLNFVHRHKWNRPNDTYPANKEKYTNQGKKSSPTLFNVLSIRGVLFFFSFFFFFFAPGPNCSKGG